MKLLPSQSPVDVACAIQDRLRANCEDASITQGMLAYINDKADFRELFRNTQAANGLNAIYSALLHNLVLALSRIYDNPSGKDRASIPRLMELLDDTTTRTLLMEAAATWVGGRFAEKNRAMCRGRIARAGKKFAALMASPLGRDALPGLKWLRDNHLAHSLFAQRKQDRLLYGQLADLLGAAIPIVHDLELAIKGNSLEDGWPIFGDHYAHTFWPVVAVGMKARRARERRKFPDTN